MEEKQHILYSKKTHRKKAVQRNEPGFVLTPFVSKSEIAFDETNQLIEKMVNGSIKMFLTSLVSDERLSQEDIESLKEIINKSEK